MQVYLIIDLSTYFVWYNILLILMKQFFLEISLFYLTAGKFSCLLTFFQTIKLNNLMVVYLLDLYFDKNLSKKQ